MYLDDVDESNGVTEFWPGTHKGWDRKDFVPNGRGWIQRAAFNRRAKMEPPIQAFIPRGSICIRGVRMWHAGMANTSQDLRVMLGFMYYPRWFMSQMNMALPEDCREIVESWSHVDALSSTRFLEGRVDYLCPSFAKYWNLNFTQEPGMSISAIRARVDEYEGRILHAPIPVTKKDYWTKPKISSRKRKVVEIEGVRSLIVKLKAPT